ncbi:hypothetical protein [Legionella sp. WA2022007384]
MAISGKDRAAIIDVLKKKTGFEWASDENRVYCKVILNASDRLEGERLFMSILQKNRIPNPQNLDSSVRGMKKGHAEVSAEFTSISVLEVLFKDSSLLEQKKSVDAKEKTDSQVATLGVFECKIS